MIYGREKNDLKILLLQIQKRRPILHISIDGDLGRKGRRDAADLVEEIKRQVATGISDFRWKPVPRARMAVAMTFFPKGKQVPALHNLVKFYMDELRNLVFTDDRQVSYLAAESWLPLKQHDDIDSEGISRVYIEVERLADYKNKFDVYFTLLRNDRFRDYLYTHRSDLLDDEKDEFEFESSYLPDSSALPPEIREFVRKHNLEERQRKLLSMNQIHAEDRPGLPRWVKFLPMQFQRLRAIEPFAVDLGNLPLKGETTLYKDRIRRSMQVLKANHKALDPIIVPVELDVQVISSKPHVSKDLDNIMRDIAPIFGEELLHADAYLHGYRIYVADTNNSEQPSDLLRLKLLPMNGVSDFEDRIRKTFEVAQDWLEEELNDFF
jgi:Holliday junction resolvase RusA-like endonuclease